MTPDDVAAFQLIAAAGHPFRITAPGSADNESDATWTVYPHWYVEFSIFDATAGLYDLIGHGGDTLSDAAKAAIGRLEKR